MKPTMPILWCGVVIQRLQRSVGGDVMAPIVFPLLAIAGLFFLTAVANLIGFRGRQRPNS